MIAYLDGKIILKREKFVILDVNGVGYKVFLSQKTLYSIPQIGQSLKLFCFHNIRENVLDLYGFLDEKELEFFEILNDIRGIGPKAAIEIASIGPLERIKDKIIAQDGNIFEGIPGIGRKRAMAIMMELSGKIRDFAKPRKMTADDAEAALVNLGFSKQNAKEALNQVPPDVQDTEGRIKIALKILGASSS